MKIISSRGRKKKKTRGRYGDGSVYKNGKLYWYKIPNPEGGKPILGSCKTDNYDVALSVLAKVRNSITAPDKPPVKVTTIGDLLDVYIKDIDRKKGSEESAHVTWRVIQKHVRPWFGKKLAAELAPQDLKEYRQVKTEGEKLSDTSVNRHFSYMRRAYVLGHEAGLVDVIPPFPKVKIYNRRTGILRQADYPRLMAVLPECLKPVLLVAYTLGTRKGELLQYTWDMCDWEKSILRVPARIRKTREDGIVPILPGEMRDTLLRQKALRDEKFPSCPWIFFWHGNDTARGRTLPGTRIKNLKASWAKAVTAIGMPSLLFHDLRRSAITNLIEEYGFSPDEARLISGHKSAEMINRYRIGTEKTILRAAEKLAAKLNAGG